MKTRKRKNPYRPKRKNKAELFKALFHYWSVKLLDKTYPIVRDNRFNGHMIAEYDFETKKTLMKYNSRKLGEWSFAMIVSGVFHEIGHILQGSLPYDTEEQQIYAEFDAESYSLEMLKEYYTKKDVSEVVSTTKKKLRTSRFRNMFPIHYSAFSQIPEYQD